MIEGGLGSVFHVVGNPRPCAPYAFFPAFPRFVRSYTARDASVFGRVFLLDGDGGLKRLPSRWAEYAAYILLRRLCLALVLSSVRRKLRWKCMGRAMGWKTVRGGRAAGGGL